MLIKTSYYAYVIIQVMDIIYSCTKVEWKGLFTFIFS